jgi:ABC-type multidrug transport system fused ATPase/permease subunit
LGTPSAVPEAKQAGFTPNETASSMAIVRRMLGFVRPYGALILAVLLCTVIFSAGRFGRAYLMKPLLDGVLLPVAEAPADQADTAQSIAPGWLSDAVARMLPTPPVATLGAAGAPPSAELERTRAALVQLLLAALVIVLITPIALFGRGYLTEFVLGRIYLDLQSRMAEKLLELPLQRHQGEKSGDLLSRALNDTQASRDAMRMLFQEFLLSITMIAIGLVTLLYISWPLTLIALLAAPAIVGVLLLFGRRIRSSAQHRQAQLGEVTGRLLGILSGIKVIKAFRGEALEAAAFSREARKLFRHDMRVVKNRVLSRSAVEALNSAAGVGMLAIGAVLVLNGSWGLSTGDIAAFATVLATTYKPIKNLAKGHGRLMEHLSAAERFFAVLDADSETEDRSTAQPIEGMREKIEFDHVSLKLPDGNGGVTQVLDDINLEVRQGEVIAIVGRTGGGKTSLMDLVLRFHEPTSGTICIDGRDLRDITRESLHRNVGVVGQEPFLFDATIHENIRYGRPEASDAEVRAAAAAAEVDEFALRLPLGYETPVGEFGVPLSGGQRQRITIARALLGRPSILIFDEATSALDTQTERLVQRAIGTMRGERTIFVIAHRLATLQQVDRVLVLEGGRLVQQGSHANLIAEEGLYRELSTLGKPSQRQLPLV